jgi:hypothetical protein
MTQKEYDWITRLKAATDVHWNELTSWEKKFMEDLLERFRQYGIRTKISKGQWDIITRISEKII